MRYEFHYKKESKNLLGTIIEECSREEDDSFDLVFSKWSLKWSSYE